MEKLNLFNRFVNEAKLRLLTLVGMNAKQRWVRRRNKMIRTSDVEKVKMAEILLDNAHTSLEYSKKSGNAHILETVLMPIILKYINSSKLDNLIGVQPIAGPVGSVFHITYSDNDDVDSPIPMKGKKPMTLQVMTSAVEAKSKKFNLKWCPENVQDKRLMFNKKEQKEFEEGLMHAFSNELEVELDSSVIESIRNESFAEDGITLNMESHTALGVYIQRAATNIARRTRRGIANWAIMSSATYAVLKNHPNMLEYPEEHNDNLLSLMGDFNSTIKIFVNTWQVNDDNILLGYKGDNDIDVGMVHAPYNILLPSGIVANIDTFEPELGFLNRSGEFKADNVSDYYANIPVKLAA